MFYVISKEEIRESENLKEPNIVFDYSFLFPKQWSVEFQA